MRNLPIQNVLPQLRDALASSPVVILQAPPGAGKTTLVPLDLLHHPHLNGKKIVMLEPRRLAATNAARWMASLLGERVGQTVGHTIRFDRRVSAATRIEVITEGVLTRRLYGDPLLEDTGFILFDEFHERNIHSDLGLALCRDLQQGLRNDLKILVMSATLDGNRLSSLLDGAPVISSMGRSYPVDVRHVGDHPREALVETVERAVRTALGETEGDILVFLPGAGEIQAVERLLRARPPHPVPLVVPLYGELPFAAQEKAILPAAMRKVVLATNIAETSLTIEGVRVVIDSGWVRRLRFDPASGLSRLVTVRVSASSAEQRAGRSGRTAPGRCYRLWSEHTQQSLVPCEPPEILTSDLAPLLLDLAAWGIGDPSALRWIDLPPSAPLSAARELLVRLDAIGADGMVTPAGLAMGAIPVHPRLSRMLLYGREKGWGSLAADLAALLSERDIVRERPGSRYSTDSDVHDRLELYHRWRAHGDGAGDVDSSACRTVDRAAGALRRLIGETASGSTGTCEQAGLLLLSAYPDRLAQRREQGRRRYLLANGRGAVLSSRSALADPPYMVAVTVEDGEGGDGAIHAGSSIDIHLVRQEFPALFSRKRAVSWDSRLGKACAREEERFGSLCLSSRPVPILREELVEGMVDAIRSEGLGILHWSDSAIRFRDRVRFLARHFPGDWPDFSEGGLLATLDQWLRPWAQAESLSQIDVLQALQGYLTFEQKRKMEQGAPSHLAVPSGSRIPLDYSAEGPPVLAVKLQELFGLGETPTVGWGRVPVILHLLSPARRPLQVTQDLRSFWNSGYLEVRKELKGRYPKHPWPDDPWNAVPTRHVTHRKGR